LNYINFMELAKAYQPQDYEDAIYADWEKSGFFNPDNLPKNYTEPYSIMMPPPNVTGVLHLGHALENALMDSMIRYQRLQGKKTLLLPGTDHAAVATQARVEKNLIKSGKYTNPRQELGRDKLLELIREYAEDSKKHIIQQVKKMGTSCDWSRLAYTFDEDRSKAVNELFIKMYNDGLIYRGYRVINWSVAGQSTCSDDELVYIERPAKMYTFKYSKDFPITIASTRPETKLGDTAVAVHPDDMRYQQYIGQTFTVDIGAKKPLEIKIIADNTVDKDMGTGALGVTPAHSQIDYTMYEIRNNTPEKIDIIQVIDHSGKMTANAGEAYVGLTVLEARKKFVQYLKDNDLLEAEEEISQNVGTSDRFDDVIEVIPMTQWFVNVNKIIPKYNKSLKDLMKEAVTVGHNQDIKNKIDITPDKFANIYFHWIDNLRDWCISRQIWWGHRIPAWYKDDEIKVSIISPGNGWNQDNDTLDTWFSSGAWTFSTLGWPEHTNDLANFHPTTWMQMGHELLFFWMARMILMTTYALDTIPFKDVYIHGILRAEDGRKFSKSLGNGIDPIEVSAKYGTDALRLSLLLGNTPGNDMRFYEEKVEHYRNTVNKLWNISRYIMMSVTEIKYVTNKPETKTISDQWIMSELNHLIKTATEDFEKFNFSQAGEKIYEFTWNKFADWYLEIAKIEKNKDDILLYILQILLKLWHPFAPFVTEVIWKNLNITSMLIVATWPENHATTPNTDFNILQNIINNTRTLRAEAGITAGETIQTTIVTKDKEIIDIINNNKNIIEKLTRIDINLTHIEPADKNSANIHASNFSIFIPVSQATQEKQAREKEKLETYINTLKNKLEKTDFATKAPKAVVEQEKQKLADAEAKLKKM